MKAIESMPVTEIRIALRNNGSGAASMADKNPKPETKRGITRQIQHEARENNKERDREKAIKEGGTFKIGKNGKWKNKSL